jgi:outer membrane protein TolC
MNKAILTLLAILLSGFIGAQESAMTFSLDEAIAYALEHNRNVKNADRNVSAAEEQKWETIATGLPQIDGNINYQNFLKQQAQVIPGSFTGGDPDELIPVIFGTEQNASASATLNQLIFDGSYIVGLQSTKVFLEISKNNLEKTELDVRQNVINAYGNVLLAEESELILKKNKDVLQKNLEETSKIYENGLEEEESVEQLQITLSGIESRLKNATRLKDIAYQMFNISIGIDINTKTLLTDTLENLTLSNISLDLLGVEDNVQDNIDFKIAQNDMKSKELMVKLEKSKALPQLSGFLNAGYLAFNNDFKFLNTDQEWFGFASFGLNVNIPIFSSLGRTAKTQRAKIELEITEENLTELEQQLRLQISRAKSDYQFSIEDYEVKKQNLRLAERIEKKNEIKFFEGIGSSFELRQAQTQLYNAQSEYLQSMLNVITNKTQLETVLNRPND